MKVIIKSYKLYYDSSYLFGDKDDSEVEYVTHWDQLMSLNEQPGLWPHTRQRLFDLLNDLVKEGKQPVVAVFIPK